MKIKITIISILLSFTFTQTFIENLKSQTPIWTGSFGTVVIDGDIYNQISMRPEFNYRNWGMGFDFYLYIDANGKLYDETWKFNTVKNAYRTILDKFRYIRYGYPGDQLYFRVGSLTNITIGNGILVSNYSNAMEYPEEKKIGLQLGKNFPKGIGFDLTISDFRKTPGLASMTLNYPISPAKHKEFSNPNQLIDFVKKLRKLSGNKPVGIKMCVGHPWELVSIVKTMFLRKEYVDFITIDGAEGGTGAAPAEFTDHLGSPLKDAIVFVDNALVGSNLRERVKIGVSGKIVSAFDIAHMCSLGADWINMARPFMFSIGCIQCRSCHTGECPTGIATMDPMRYRAIDIDDRSQRAFNFHKNTLFVFKELLESVGVEHPSELNRRHIVRRLSESEIRLADQIYPKAEKGELTKKGKLNIEDPRLNVYWNKVSSKSFNYIQKN